MVFLKLTNGGERYLLEVLTNVLNFWEDYLHSHGILPSKRVFQCKDPFRRRTRAECKDTSDGIQLTQGLPAQLRLRFMRFDEAVGRAIPVDLTGSKIEFRVFKPKPVELVISAIRNADGKVFEKSVQLQPEEAHEVENCADDEAKSRFLSTLPAVKKALGDLNAELKAQEGQANSAVQ